MPDASGAIDLSALSAEEQQAVGEMAERNPGAEESQERIPLRTAFTVIIAPDGTVNTTPYDGTLFELEREPHPDEIYGSCATVLKDMSAVETASATVRMQMQQAHAIQEQMQHAQIAQNLNLPGQPGRG